jgi:hypothetical protein
MSTSEQSFYELLRGATVVSPTAPTDGSSVEKDLIVGDPDAGTPVTIRNLFIHHDTHPMVMYLALIKTLGPDWTTWDSSTIWAEIKRNFKTDISEHARAKIQSVRTIHNSKSPWEFWQVFEKVIQGLNNNLPTWETMQVPTLEQLYAGIDIMGTIREEMFSDEVKAYIAAAVLAEEVTFVPAPLDFVQMEVSQPRYRCLDCGGEESALFSDGICGICSRKYDPDRGMSLQPNQELVSKGIGKNVTTELVHDYRPVESRWMQERGKRLSDVSLNEAPEDVQVGKLLVARDYMNIRRRQLADQLTNLKSWLGAA